MSLTEVKDPQRHSELTTFMSFYWCVCVCVCVCVFHCVQLFMIPWTVTHQAPLSMEFSRQEYWCGLHFLLQGSFWPRNRTHISCVSCISRRVPYHWATWNAPAFTINQIPYEVPVAQLWKMSDSLPFDLPCSVVIGAVLGRGEWENLTQLA